MVIVSVAFLNLVVYAFSKKFIWDMILKTDISFEKNRTKTIKLFSFKYLLSVIIDAGIVLPISLFFFLVIQKWMFIDFNLIVIVCAIIYFFAYYYITRSTPGKKISPPGRYS
jgi:L-asparagine transporter-like permease